MVPVVLVFVVVQGFLLSLDLERKGWEQIESVIPDRGIPRMNITLNGVSLEEINEGSKDTKYEGNELTVYDGRDDVFEYSDVRVKGRGNGTWIQKKKPYQIKFSHKVNMFGMGKAKKWILLANATDVTNLRTAAAFYLEGVLGMQPALRGEFVELYVDEQYVGLYYLAQAVEIEKNLVDLKNQMGVLVELDNLYWETEKYYETQNGDKLVLKDVKSEDVAEAAMADFLRDYNNFEQAVMEKDYEMIQELIDIESFAQYYLLSEFTVNPDAYWTSFYMYRDGPNDKIHAGPGWDFDFAFANRGWGNWLGEEFYSSMRTMIRKKELMTKDAYEGMGLIATDGIDWYNVSLSLSRIMFDLMDVPEFRKEVQGIYKEKMKWRKNELLLEVKKKAGDIFEAVFADEEKWDNGGFWEEIEIMEKWINERYDYFDRIYGGEVVLIEEAS